MRYLKISMLLMGATILVLLYIIAKLHTSYTNDAVPSTDSRYTHEQRAETENLNDEIRVVQQKKYQMSMTDDSWAAYPEELSKQIIATQVHAKDLVDRFECYMPENHDQVCTTLLFQESHLRLDLANNDIKIMRLHALEAKGDGKIETGLAIVDVYVNKHKPPPFLRDIAYTATEYLKIIVLRESIERLTTLFRLGPRVNVLGNI